MSSKTETKTKPSASQKPKSKEKKKSGANEKKSDTSLSRKGSASKVRKKSNTSLSKKGSASKVKKKSNTSLSKKGSASKVKKKSNTSLSKKGSASKVKKKSNTSLSKKGSASKVKKKSNTSLSKKRSSSKIKKNDEEGKSTTSSRRRSKSSKEERKSDMPTQKPINRTLQLPDSDSEPPSFEGRMDPDEPLPATQYVSWRIERPVALHKAKTGPLAQKPMTMMTVLKDAANRHPKKLAYASMVDGVWVKVTYQNFLEQVLQAAQSFIKLGLQRFNGVGILGNNATEYVVVHFGVIFAGGVSVPLHVNAADEFTYNLVKMARCRIIVVDSIKERNQVLDWKQKLPQLKTIIQYGNDKFEETDDQINWKHFMKIGNDVAPDVLVTRTLQQAPNLCCCVLQTAGCSGFPKNVMLSHDNLVWGANTIGRYMSLSDGSGVIIGFIPLSTILGLTVTVNIAVRFGATVYLLPMTRNKGMVARVLKEVRPTIFFAPTVFYELIHRELESKLRRSSIVRRIVTSWAMKLGRQAFDDQTRRARPPPGWSLANRLLFRKVRKGLGLDRCQELFAAGGFMLRSDIDFFLSLDMPLLMAYGLTESSGSHTCCLLEKFRIESVGVEMDGCQTKIVNPDANGVGELQIGGRNLAMGYLESEELTMKYYTEDGTFRTGDLARKDADGFIYIVGRRSEVVTLSGGEKISTIPIIKSVMSDLPFVSHALIIGDGRPYLALLMTIKTEVDEKTGQPSDRLTERSVTWFRKAGFNVKLVKDIVPKANPKLLETIQVVIDRINAQIPHEAHQIKRWTFLSSDFTTATDELSPTLKIKRWIVVKKFAVTIDSMYS